MLNLKKYILTPLSTLVFSQVFAGSDLVRPIPEIGPHKRIIQIEKNQNPENILIVYTKLNEHCNFVSVLNDTPVFDYYWLMNGISYKPLNFTLKSEIEKRITLNVPPEFFRERIFYVSLNDLHAVHHDIPNPRLEVTSKFENNECKVVSTMQLGPSDNSIKIQVNAIYGESPSVLRPKITLVTIKGRELATGKSYQRTYFAKK